MHIIALINTLFMLQLFTMLFTIYILCILLLLNAHN